jgi:hypothetical protein
MATIPSTSGTASKTHTSTVRRSHFSREDVIGITIAAVSLLAGGLVAHYRVPYFWYDELATWTMVSDPSLSHMLSAIRHGTESNPPLYELVMWVWAAIAGDGELSLRLASIVFMIAAMMVLWSALRHAYRAAPTALGIGTVFFGAQVILEQLPQARFYGLFALCTAIAVALAIKAGRTGETDWRLLVATFFAHFALVYSHVFGSFFSAAILAAIVVADIRSRRFRMSLYAAVIGAWVTFLPWIPAVLEQRTLGTGRSWLSRPTRGDLFMLIGSQTLWLPLVAVVTVVTAALTGDDESARPRETADGGRARLAFAVVAAGLLAVVPAVFLLSRVAVPIFLDRYLLPSAFGWAIIVAHLVHHLGDNPAKASPPRPMPFRSRVDAASALLFFVLALYPVVFAFAHPRAVRPDVAFGNDIDTLPIVVESGHQFWPLQHYATLRGDRYRFLVDSAIAEDPDNAPGAAQEQKLMELYRREGYLRGSVEDGPEFLCAHRRFVVVDRPGFIWFERRVRGDESYRWHTIGKYLDSAVQLVERNRGCIRRP